MLIGWHLPAALEGACTFGMFAISLTSVSFGNIDQGEMP